jgi:hypothetical protein
LEEVYIDRSEREAEIRRGKGRLGKKNGGDHMFHGMMHVSMREGDEGGKEELSKVL